MASVNTPQSGDFGERETSFGGKSPLDASVIHQALWDIKETQGAATAQLQEISTKLVRLEASMATFGERQARVEEKLGAVNEALNDVATKAETLRETIKTYRTWFLAFGVFIGAAFGVVQWLGKYLSVVVK